MASMNFNTANLTFRHLMGNGLTYRVPQFQTEFDRLYDPRHPVRNHLETLDSVEVVRTIREALKR
ncbi:MAG: hypothetical protein AB1461_07220 [Thermodesulfobacteriota bacterium]